LKLIEDRTRVGTRDCIKFIPRTTEATYIEVYNSNDGCWSYIGKQRASGKQQLSLQTWNGQPGTNCIFPVLIAHEFIHALGYRY
jgi:hypothetical protein